MTGSPGGDPFAQTVAARFSAAAHRYDDGASVQKSIAAHLGPLLSRRPEPRRILELGCGSGQLTRLLLTTFPSTPIEAVDLSPRMVEVARAALPDQVTLHVADARTFQGTSTFDLIISSSALHWMTPLDKTIEHLAEQLSGTGSILLACMLDGTLSSLRDSRLRVAPHKPPHGRLPNHNQVTQALQGAGLNIALAEEHVVTEAHGSAQTFLRHIHEQGLTGGAVSQSSTPLNRSELQALVRDYQSRYADDTGSVTATYHTLIIEASRDA